MCPLTFRSGGVDVGDTFAPIALVDKAEDRGGAVLVDLETGSLVKQVEFPGAGVGCARGRRRERCIRFDLGIGHRTLQSPEAEGRADGELPRYLATTRNVALRNICAVTIVSDLVVLGSLDGEIYAVRLDRPGLPIATSTRSGSCWSFRKDPVRTSVWVGRGDGFIAEYDVVVGLTRPHTRVLQRQQLLNPGALDGLENR
jgi:hypothetical protein